MSERDPREQMNDKFAESPLSDSELKDNQKIDAQAAKTDREKHPSTEPTGDAGMSSAKAAMALTRWHPFMAYFLFITDCNAPKSMEAHDRVRAMRNEQPCFYRWCLIADWVVLLLIVVGVLGLGVVVALKALGIWWC